VEQAQEKFKRYLRGKYPELTEAQIEEAAARFSDLAIFLLRLSLRRHSQKEISESDKKVDKNNHQYYGKRNRGNSEAAA
jgi:hypothetical protein